MADSIDSGAVDAQRRADLQYAVSRVLSEAASIEAVGLRLLPALAEALQWDYAGFWLVAEAGDILRCVDTWCIDDPRVQAFARVSRESRFPPGAGLPGRTWSAAEAMWLSSFQRDPAVPRTEYARAADLLGGLAFPIVNSRGVVGVVECFTREAERITPELLRLTEAIGRQVGQFLQRREAEQRLEDNEARYAAIVNGALDAIIAIDEDGHVLEFNPAAERMFGYARAEALGRDLADLVVPERLRAAHRAGLRRHRESAESNILERRIELVGVRADGTEFPLEVTITRMRLARGWSFIGFMRDITERQQHERERERLMAAERGARDQAVEASALKDEFLAALSHELRTPLNAVLGWSDMLVKGAVDPARTRQIAGTIRRNALTQQQLVEDMLDLSSFIAGRVRLAIEPVPLDEPAQAACEVVRPAADAKRIQMRVSVAPCVVPGDRTRLQQVFWNLLSNAVKFTPAGGSVTLAAAPAGDQVVVTVTDTGRGIDPAFLPFVFDRFRQGRNARGEGGVGLGLSIVKQIVEAHGGTITVHSAGAEQGTTFSVMLPAAPG